MLSSEDSVFVFLKSRFFIFFATFGKNIFKVSVFPEPALTLISPAIKVIFFRRLLIFLEFCFSLKQLIFSNAILAQSLKIIFLSVSYLRRTLILLFGKGDFFSVFSRLKLPITDATFLHVSTKGGFAPGELDVPWSMLLFIISKRLYLAT